MKQPPNEAELTAKVVARIHEFRVVRGLSVDQLVEAAELSDAERLIIQGQRDVMTIDLVKRIARAFNVHPAVLLMAPDEDPMAQLLEQFRDVPKDEFQRIAGELISRGYRRSTGSA